MRWSKQVPRRSRVVRCAAFLTVLTCLAGLLTSISSAAAAPSNPSDGQISAAQQEKAALADQVGQLGAQVAQMQATLAKLKGNLELAEQKVAYTLQLLDQAKTAAAAAAHNVVAAQSDVDRARNAFNGYMQQLYMGGQVSGTTGALLTASDPNSLLQQSTLDNYQSDHQISAIGDLQRATVAKSNADAKARAAVAAEGKAAQAAKDAQAAAANAVSAAQAQQAQLQSTLSATQTKLQAAQLHLADLNNQRQKYLAYQAEQARLAEIRRQQELARQRAAAAAAAAAAANNGGGGGGGGGGGYAPPPASGGSWTSQAGQIAVARARQWLGHMYAWAGGNASGPTYGVCAGDGAWNDCHIIGFDCSGLVMYAWAQYPFAHYAATQYLQGSIHPSTDQLQPGDLVFWSSNGSIDGIHHVAIYEGGGMVIQAPESGEVIQETPLGEVSWGYFGATRPLT